MERKAGVISDPGRRDLGQLDAHPVTRARLKGICEVAKSILFSVSVEIDEPNLVDAVDNSGGGLVTLFFHTDLPPPNLGTFKIFLRYL